MWKIVFFPKGAIAHPLSLVKSEYVNIKRQDGSVIHFEGIGDSEHSWAAKDGMQEVTLPADLASGQHLTICFETFPHGGEARQLVKWDNEVIEDVHYDDVEDIDVET